uniref:Uncharacterized protein n=1 Tax=Cannabis sativa TaxID=3483 RepID=A0A803RBM5_CANSA
MMITMTFLNSSPLSFLLLLLTPRSLSFRLLSQLSLPSFPQSLFLLPNLVSLAFLFFTFLHFRPVFF